MGLVTFSGFNNFDFGGILDAIVAQERQPLTRLQGQKSSLETQSTAYGTLATKLTSFLSAVESLADETSVSGLKVESSDAGVGVTTASGSVEGSYDIVVSTLARRQVTASVSTYASPDDVVATAGTLTLVADDGTQTLITVATSTTLEALAEAINAESGAPVTASLVQSSPGSYQLVLTGKNSGVDNAFTLSNTLSGGAGLSFGDDDDDGVSGDSSADNAQSAANATFTVNSLAITSSSNTVADVVPGVTLSLTRADPNTTVTIDVSRDLDEPKDRVNGLLTAYNDVVAFIDQQQSAAAKGLTNIARDPLVRDLRDSLRTTIMAEYASGGSLARLAEVGVGFDRDGKLVLDETLLDNSLATSVADVQGLFSGPNGGGGVFGALDTLITNFSQAGGLIADARELLSSQVQRLDTRIDSLSRLLDQRRDTLQREFAAADTEMSRLNSQIGALDGLLGQFRLF